jgi:hypothetical protein
MEDAIELRFRYSETEYVRAYRSYCLFKRRAAFFILLAGSLIVIGFYLLATGRDVVLIVSFFTTGAFLFGLSFTSSYLLPRQRFRTDPRFRGEYFLRFSDNGIEFHTNDIDSKVAWRIYKEAVETKDFYLLSDGASTLTVIPKRVFANSGEELQFRTMLDAKV